MRPGPRAGGRPPTRCGTRSGRRIEKRARRRVPRVPDARRVQRSVRRDVAAQTVIATPRTTGHTSAGLDRPAASSRPAWRSCSATCSAGSRTSASRGIELGSAWVAYASTRSTTRAGCSTAHRGVRRDRRRPAVRRVQGALTSRRSPKKTSSPHRAIGVDRVLLGPTGRTPRAPRSRSTTCRSSASSTPTACGGSCATTAGAAHVTRQARPNRSRSTRPDGPRRPRRAAATDPVGPTIPTTRTGGSASTGLPRGFVAVVARRVRLARSRPRSTPCPTTG